MNAPIVSFNHVGKSFDVDGFELEAIREFNLEIAEGEFVAIVGASGCGKSTLLRLLVGLDTQFRGQIQVDGKAVSGIGGERGIVFQEHRLFPWLTVAQTSAWAWSTSPWTRPSVTDASAISSSWWA
ncbi:sulfate ester ABC transporter, ATP-binding protein AtsC [Pseudomonas synxantha]|uniref:Sulfate ester ABC transporter, ATP-binding protein AtsC n=1 Tax=Pseudomonas synxantha TaxID=47883 RepID=A0AAX3I049_9PSED|nr:sulfate ester ABC transporter, ATP-binding protein AtsC [Pseudomonas synxantha]